jgi:hypothetical protein
MTPSRFRAVGKGASIRFAVGERTPVGGGLCDNTHCHSFHPHIIIV